MKEGSLWGALTRGNGGVQDKNEAAGLSGWRGVPQCYLDPDSSLAFAVCLSASNLTSLFLCGKKRVRPHQNVMIGTIHPGTVKYQAPAKEFLLEVFHFHRESRK